MTRPQRAASPAIALDFLRGLAALLVVLVHTRGSSFVEFGALPVGQRTLPVAVFFGFTRLGQEAVLTFFVLSGFLVGGQVIERVRQARFDLRTYAIDRCSRIFLPLVPACLFTGAISLLVFHEQTNAALLAANMTGLNGLFAPTLARDLPLWTLSYEIWFYVVGGALGYLAINRSSPGAIAVLALCAIVFSVQGARFLLYWALGALMIFLLKGRHLRLMFLSGTLLAIGGGLLLELALPSRSLTTVIPISTETSEAIICIGVAAMIPFLCSEYVNRSIGFLRAPAAGLASMSYSVYLFHYPVNTVLDRFFTKAPELDLTSVSYFLARIAICLTVSAAFYFCFERNTKYVRRWLQRPARPYVTVRLAE